MNVCFNPFFCVGPISFSLVATLDTNDPLGVTIEQRRVTGCGIAKPATSRFDFFQDWRLYHKRSNVETDVSHDQIEVRATLAEPNANGADQRGAL